MADIFQKENVINLLTGKRITFFGGSNMRHLYKDLVWLINSNTIAPDLKLRKKMECSFEGDKLVASSGLTAGRNYKENRKYSLNGIKLEYYFITRCLHDELKKLLENIRNDKSCAPDVIVMNSTLWDINRWGPKGVDQFKNDLRELMKLLNDVLPKKTMFVWTTALPPGKKVRKGGLLIKQVEFLELTIRFEVMEANMYAKNVATEFGYDVLDLHYHLRMQVHRRHSDGLHYNALATRLVTNLLLTHIALSWDHPLPGNVNNTILDRYTDMVSVSSPEQSTLPLVSTKPPSNEKTESSNECTVKVKSNMQIKPVEWNQTSPKRSKNKVVSKKRRAPRRRPLFQHPYWNSNSYRNSNQRKVSNSNQFRNYSQDDRSYHDMHFSNFTNNMNNTKRRRRFQNSSIHNEYFDHSRNNYHRSYYNLLNDNVQRDYPVEAYDNYQRHYYNVNNEYLEDDRMNYPVHSNNNNYQSNSDNEYYDDIQLDSPVRSHDNYHRNYNYCSGYRGNIRRVYHVQPDFNYRNYHWR